MLLRAVAVCASVSLSAVTFSARAAMVGPGQSISYDSEADVGYSPPGAVVAQQTVTKTFTYDVVSENPTPAHPQLTFDIVNTVYRASDGHLTFGFGPAKEYIQAFAQRWTIGTGNYDDFMTDVHSRSAETISRDNSGNVTLSVPEFNGAAFPNFYIETSATSFNKGGFADIFGGDEFQVKDPGGFDRFAFAGTQGSLSGLYQPTNQSPTAVPLPPAVYGGLAMLLLVIGVQVRRLRLV